MVRYDTEADEGIVWTALEYDCALAYRFTPDLGVIEAMIGAYSKVAEVLDSEWKKELIARAQATDSSVSPELRHFVTYFDHHGALEVLARSVQVK